ncbi:MAG: hypothetical protein MI919_35005, partial [Holophagales bacterium]|nr:hypothetical protein [Holophagales bacterium]
VVCGHLHRAEFRGAVGRPRTGQSPAAGAEAVGQRTGEPESGETARPVDYFNCGDWVESCTLLVEGFDGRLEIVDGLELEARWSAEEARIPSTQAEPGLPGVAARTA